MLGYNWSPQDFPLTGMIFIKCSWDTEIFCPYSMFQPSCQPFKVELYLYTPAALRSSNYAFCICELYVILSETAIISSNFINKLIFVTATRCVFFAVRPEFVHIILTSFGFKGLKFSQAGSTPALFAVT
jgi:hypothetical protein